MVSRDRREGMGVEGRLSLLYISVYFFKYYIRNTDSCITCVSQDHMDSIIYITSPSEIYFYFYH